MKFCEECGNQLDDDAIFCDECGAAVEPDVGVQPETDAAADAMATPELVGNTENVVPTAEMPENSPVQETDTEKHSKKGLIAGLVSLAVVVAVVVVLFAFEIIPMPGANQGSNTEVASGSAAESESEQEQETSSSPSAASKEKKAQVTATPKPKDSSYLLANSDSEYLTEDDLSGLTSLQLRYARNEIYARHGYIFSDEEMYKHFLKKTWYKPTVEASKFKESTELNEYEKANIKLITSVEKYGYDKNSVSDRWKTGTYSAVNDDGQWSYLTIESIDSDGIYFSFEDDSWTSIDSEYASFINGTTTAEYYDKEEDCDYIFEVQFDSSIDLFTDYQDYYFESD